jgi:hypothetical protein
MEQGRPPSSALGAEASPITRSCFSSKALLRQPGGFEGLGTILEILPANTKGKGGPKAALPCRTNTSEVGVAPPGQSRVESSPSNGAANQAGCDRPFG